MRAAERLIHGSGWDPRELPTLEAQYMSPRISGVTDGAGLATWVDLSGKGRDAAQATSGKQPIYHSSGGPNNQPYVSYDGSDDFSATSTFTGIAQPLTFLLVAHLNTDPALGAQKRLFDGGTNSEMTFYDNNSAGTKTWRATAALTLTDGTPDTASWHAFVVVVNGASSKIRIDGGAGTGGNCGGGTLTGICIAAQGGGGSSRNANADYTEMHVCSSSLSLVDINKFGAYAASKYGIAWATAT